MRKLILIGLPIIGVIFFAIFTNVSTSKISVDSVSALRTAVLNLKPGSVLKIKNGSYHFDTPLNISAKGTVDKKIIICAAETGKVVFTGAGLLVKNSSYCVFRGIVFKTDDTGIKVEDFNTIRITRCIFQVNPISTKSFWLKANKPGTSLTVDRCEFGPRKLVKIDNKPSGGSYLHISGGVHRVHVHHNYFHDFENVGMNGGTTLYLHGGHGHRWDFDSIVENNLFVRCNGESEMIGIKSHQNTVRFNTMIDCNGGVSVRGGDHNRIYNNYFLFTNTNPALKRSYAITIQGFYNKVFNNLVYGYEIFIRNCRADTTIPYISRESRLAAWKSDEDPYIVQEIGYRGSFSNIIAFNTVISTKNIFQFEIKGLKELAVPGSGHKVNPKKLKYAKGKTVTILPEYWTFANNALIDFKKFENLKIMRTNMLGVILDDPYPLHKNFSWQNNLFGDFDSGNHVFAKHTFKDNQMRNFKPVKERLPHQYRLNSQNDLATGSVEIPEYSDLEGETRYREIFNSLTRVGCMIKARPLTVKDVGPFSAGN